MLHLPLISKDLWTAIDDPAARIDRMLTDRSYRLSMGIEVDAAMRTMQCALAMTSGHGKYLRVSHVVGQRVELPQSMTENWNELRESESPPLAGYRQFVADLADLQVQAIEQVKRKAGKYVDRILFASVLDPGLWLKDFDGSKIYCGLTDSHRIAETTGLTVIDDHPANDVIAGGQGGPLAGLPMWLTLSDRSPKVADQHRVVLLPDETCEGYLLPASDGLDTELPEIKPIAAPGQRFLRVLNSAMGEGSFPDLEPADIHQPLLQAWQQTGTDEDALVRVALKIAKKKNLKSTTILATAIKMICNACVQQIHNGGRGMEYLGPQPAASNVCRIYVFGKSNLQAALVRSLQTEFSIERVVTETEESVSGENARGLTAALLGILHVDQMQANIPMITGARQQRVLGRLTPGSPSNWRQLVRDMSDFRPSAMKLKDAI